MWDCTRKAAGSYVFYSLLGKRGVQEDGNRLRDTPGRVVAALNLKLSIVRAKYRRLCI
jgi:hypothetical protein